MSFRNEQGLTILELLIVIAIIGLIGTIATIQLTGSYTRAKIDTARLQIKQIDLAIELYKFDVGNIPEEKESLKALIVQPQSVEGWRGPYLNSNEAIMDPWGHQYLYKKNANHIKGYDVFSLGRDNLLGGDGEDADILSK